MATETPGLLGVGILTWNDGEDARRAAKSVKETHPAAEVVILDNGSEPPFDGQGVAPDIRILRNDRNLGVAAGRNRLLAETNATIFCLLDSDARVMAGCLESLRGAVLSDSGVGLAAPTYEGLHPAESAGKVPSPLRKLARALRLTSRYASAHAASEGVRDVEFAIGACQVVRRQALEEIGGYDESIFFGPEDLEVCVRLREAGWRVVQVDAATCYHKPRRAHRNLLTERGRRHAYSVLRYYLKRRTR